MKTTTIRLPTMEQEVRSLNRRRADDMRSIIEGAMNEVRAHPVFNVELLGCLVGLTVNLCADLNKLAKENPKAVRRVAVRMPCWVGQIKPNGHPVMKPSKAKELMKEIRLGAAFGRDVEHNTDSPLSRFIYNYCFLWRPIDLKLPAFNRKTIPRYVKAVMLRLKDDTKICSESIPMGYKKYSATFYAKNPPHEPRWSRIEAETRKILQRMLPAE